MKTKRVLMTLLLLLTSSLALIGCGSKSQNVKPPERPHLTAPDPQWMEPEQPNLRQRLQQLSTESPVTATAPSGS